MRVSVVDKSEALIHLSVYQITSPTNASGGCLANLNGFKPAVRELAFSVLKNVGSLYTIQPSLVKKKFISHWFFESGTVVRSFTTMAQKYNLEVGKTSHLWHSQNAKSITVDIRGYWFLNCCPITNFWHSWDSWPIILGFWESVFNLSQAGCIDPRVNFLMFFGVRVSSLLHEGKTRGWATAQQLQLLGLFHACFFTSFPRPIPFRLLFSGNSSSNKPE